MGVASCSGSAAAAAAAAPLAVGAGPHGLIRLLTSDWDDGFHTKDATYNTSESTLTAGLVAYVLPRFAAVLDAIGEHGNATKARAFADADMPGPVTITRFQEYGSTLKHVRRDFVDNITMRPNSMECLYRERWLIALAQDSLFLGMTNRIAPHDCNAYAILRYPGALS